jgi:hypothetical protein
MSSFWQLGFSVGAYILRKSVHVTNINMSNIIQHPSLKLISIYRLNEWIS